MHTYITISEVNQAKLSLVSLDITISIMLVLFARILVILLECEGCEAISFEAMQTFITNSIILVLFARILVSLLEFFFIQIYLRYRKLKSRKKNLIHPELKPDGLEMMTNDGRTTSGEYPQIDEENPGTSRILGTEEIILVVPKPNPLKKYSTQIDTQLI